VNEIGGNKILIEDQSSRIFLDFGKNYSKENDFFDFPLLQPRQEKHLLATGILPNLPGFYKQDGGSQNVQGILLSHPHGDHWDYIRYVKDNIPIGCSLVCKEVIIARERSSKLGPSSEYYVSHLTSKGPTTYKTFEVFPDKGPSTFGGLSFDAYEVDHSIPGCSGFIFHTSSGSLVYTGDLRFSGPRANLSMEFMEAAKASDPMGLIIEGTNIAEANISSEVEVRDKTNSIVQNAPGIVMVGCSVADLDRLQTLFDVAKANGRTIAITMKQAFMIHSLRVAGQPIFDVGDKNAVIFQKEKMVLQPFEKQMEGRYSNRIDSSYVNSHQSNLLLILGFYEFNELVGIEPIPGSVYLLSQSEPFNEEMELQFAKLKNWLSIYGVPLYQAHSSGHAKPQELRKFISEVSPKNVFLIHTEQPELYRTYISDLKARAVLPVEGHKLTL